MASDLKLLLLEIKKNETNYDVRERLVYQALGLAAILGMPCGIRVDEKEPAWPVVCITLPTGEVSWHCPASKVVFTGYSTEEKYKRVYDYVCG